MILLRLSLTIKVGHVCKPKVINPSFLGDLREIGSQVYLSTPVLDVQVSESTGLKAQS